MGSNELHSKDKDSIANKTLQSLGAILQSYQSLDVKEAHLEFRITILSKDHMRKIASKLRKKKVLPKNILRTESEDESDLVGVSNNEMLTKNEKVSIYLFKTPQGFPAQPLLFKNNCLLVSVAIGTLYHEAQTESDSKQRLYKERCVTYINSTCKTNSVFRQNYAGYNILKRCRELISDLDGVKFEGPHPYKILHDLVQKRQIRIIVFKDNKIKHAFPREFDGKRVQIALLETSSSYLQDEKRLHVDFIKNPKKYFYGKMFQCVLCLQMKSPERNHNRCVRSQCKFCRKILLRKSEYFDNTYKNEYCNRVIVGVQNLTKCNSCDKDIPQTCVSVHSLVCKKIYECKNCGITLHARSAKRLKVDISNHRCFNKTCKICFLSLSPKDFKSHACQMKNVQFHDVYNRLAYFDIECLFEDGMTSFEPIMIVCEYENVLFGNYSRFSWADEEIKHPELGTVIDNVGQYDYMGDLPNRIAPRKLNPKYRSRKNCWPRNTDPLLLNTHFSLEDPNLNAEVKKFSQECWANYRENLKKFSHLTHLQNNCIFHFLAFFLTKSFVNTSFLSHNGAR